MQSALYLYFDGLSHPLQLTGCDHLIDDFPVLFPELDYQEQQCPSKFSDNQDVQPLISIQYDGKKYHISTAWEDETNLYSDKVDVLCDLVAKLAVARSMNDPQALYLHAAAVVINEKMVVFPSQFRAGKSFLTACLVAAGNQYIGDDVVPLNVNHIKGHSIGFAPRLRLPIPVTTDEQSEKFIKSRMALAGKRYAYLNIETELRVPRSRLIDIGAFVLLEREDGIEASLEELSVATVFQQLIKQNFAREIDGGLILTTLTQAVSNAQCIKIRYDRADEAVRVLSEHFANWPSTSENIKIDLEHASRETKSQFEILDNHYIQNQEAQKIRIEGEYFITSPDGKTIYHLNPIGSGIWELLAEPTSMEEIVSILTTAFPDIEVSAIKNDAADILKQLLSNNLIHH